MYAHLLKYLICSFSFLAIDPKNTDTIEIYTGLTESQFQEVLVAIEPHMRPSFNNIKTLELALYVYLLKLRTNHTYKQIAPHIGICTFTVSAWIGKMRKLVHDVFVPPNLLNQTRENLLINTTPLSRKIYNVDGHTAVIVLDGTYVYTIKSSNFEFQKKTYSKQFKRNLVKFMLIVTTNGYIAAAYGPFEARMNDASILKEILNAPDSIFRKLRPGDVVVVDRGFRDVNATLRNCGFVVKTPKGTKNNALSRADANESRLATKTRYVVEVRNTHIKNKWKKLSGTNNYQSIPLLKNDFQVCCSFVNAFCCKIVSDRNDWNAVGDLMLAKVNEQNILPDIVRYLSATSFKLVMNLTLFPKWTYDQLKRISQGTYQIRLSKSYGHSHFKANNNSFPINVCDDINLLKKYCQNKVLLGPKPLLLCLNLLSRFESNKRHKAYVLLDLCNNEYILKAYCCTCRHGRRTVGCCGHVMLLIWYTLHIDHNNLNKCFPSSNLDHVFDDWHNVEPDSEGDTESTSNSNSNEVSESESD